MHCVFSTVSYVKKRYSGTYYVEEKLAKVVILTFLRGGCGGTSVEYILNSSSPITIHNEIVVELTPDIPFIIFFSLFYQAGQHLHIWLTLLSADSEMLTERHWHRPNPTTARVTCVYLLWMRDTRLSTHYNLVVYNSQYNGLGLVFRNTAALHIKH